MGVVSNLAVLKRRKEGTQTTSLLRVVARIFVPVTLRAFLYYGVTDLLQEIGLHLKPKFVLSCLYIFLVISYLEAVVVACLFFHHILALAHDAYVIMSTRAGRLSFSCFDKHLYSAYRVWYKRPFCAELVSFGSHMN
jgi:hypothetical protein